MIPEPLKQLYLKTAITSVIAAPALIWFSGLVPAGVFAAGAVLGLANWVLLGVALIAFTEGKIGVSLFAIGVKLFVLASIPLVVIPPVTQWVLFFLLGFMMFLIACLLDALGRMGGLFAQWSAAQRLGPVNSSEDVKR